MGGKSAADDDNPKTLRKEEILMTMTMVVNIIIIITIGQPTRSLSDTHTHIHKKNKRQQPHLSVCMCIETHDQIQSSITNHFPVATTMALDGVLLLLWLPLPSFFCNCTLLANRFIYIWLLLLYSFRKPNVRHLFQLICVCVCNMHFTHTPKL